jgi:hypothetical protein
MMACFWQILASREADLGLTPRRKRASGSNTCNISIILANFSLKGGHIEDNAEDNNICLIIYYWLIAYSREAV